MPGDNALDLDLTASTSGTEPIDRNSLLTAATATANVVGGSSFHSSPSSHMKHPSFNKTLGSHQSFPQKAQGGLILIHRFQDQQGMTMMSVSSSGLEVDKLVFKGIYLFPTFIYPFTRPLFTTLKWNLQKQTHQSN